MSIDFHEKSDQENDTSPGNLVIQEQLETKTSNAGYFTIFRYATNVEVILIFISLIACGVGGAGLPLMMVSISLPG
jgi:hypothetical protein